MADAITQGRWDYVIIGAGSAGCVVANRLSADPSVRVLLLEAGGEDNKLWYKVPALGPLTCLGDPEADWNFATAPGQAGAGGSTAGRGDASSAAPPRSTARSMCAAIAATTTIGASSAMRRLGL